MPKKKKIKYDPDLLPVPGWFWEMIEEAKPSLQKLAGKLEALEREKLEDFYGLYMAAAHDLCEPWNGPYIDEAIDHLSEDSTKDLTEWIVSQGYEYWASIARFEEEEEREKALSESFWTETKVSKGRKVDGLFNWSEKGLDPAYKGSRLPHFLAMAVYEKRFGEDIYDHEEEIFDRIEEILL